MFCFSIVVGKNNSFDKSEFLKNPDMSGPVLITVVYGMLLALGKKLSFGYIYGFSFFGSFMVYFILNLLLKK